MKRSRHREVRPLGRSREAKQWHRQAKGWAFSPPSLRLCSARFISVRTLGEHTSFRWQTSQQRFAGLIVSVSLPPIPDLSPHLVQLSWTQLSRPSSCRHHALHPDDRLPASPADVTTKPHPEWIILLPPPCGTAPGRMGQIVL